LDKVYHLDADIASAFAKIKRLELLKRLFSKHRIVITPEIYEELTTSLDYGYTFPLDIFRYFEVLYPSEEESEEYQKLLIEKRTLGKGELEAISICRHRIYTFSSIDATALRLAEENGVEILELHSILRSLWGSVFQSKEEVRGIITEIEKKDNTKIKDIDAVFR
jgi:Predicted nucleic acid-binding protein, contains PIN domain